MSSFDNLCHLPGGVSQRNNYPHSSAIESAGVSAAAQGFTFQCARVRKYDSGDSASGTASHLEVRLPFQPGCSVLGSVRLRCMIGGLSAHVEELVVSADAITAWIRVPNGIDPQRTTLIELTWFTSSQLLKEMTIMIQGAR